MLRCFFFFSANINLDFALNCYRHTDNVRLRKIFNIIQQWLLFKLPTTRTYLYTGIPWTILRLSNWIKYAKACQGTQAEVRNPLNLKSKISFNKHFRCCCCFVKSINCILPLSYLQTEAEKVFLIKNHIQ